MFQNESKFWNWLVVSSENPTKVAATVKGMVGLCVAFLAVLVHGPSLSNLPDQVYTVILDAFGVVSAAITVAGAVRKVWNTIYPLSPEDAPTSSTPVSPAGPDDVTPA